MCVNQLAVSRVPDRTLSTLVPHPFVFEFIWSYGYRGSAGKWVIWQLITDTTHPSKNKIKIWKTKPDSGVGDYWSLDVDKMYSNVSQTQSTNIDSHSNTSVQVFQQPTRLILTDVCKQSTVQPVQLSSTSQIHTDPEQLSDSSSFFFFRLLLLLIHVIHIWLVYHKPLTSFSMMKQILTPTLRRHYTPGWERSLKTRLC